MANVSFSFRIRRSMMVVDLFAYRCHFDVVPANRPMWYFDWWNSLDAFCGDWIGHRCHLHSWFWRGYLVQPMFQMNPFDWSQFLHLLVSIASSGVLDANQPRNCVAFQHVYSLVHCTHDDLGWAPVFLYKIANKANAIWMEYYRTNHDGHIPQRCRLHRHQNCFGLMDELLVFHIGFDVGLQKCLLTFGYGQKSTTNGMDFAKCKGITSTRQWNHFGCAEGWYVQVKCAKNWYYD